MNSCIIAGSRTIEDYPLLKEVIKESGFVIDEIVCGLAGGVDLMGKRYGEENNIPVKEFPAQWDDLTKLPSKIKTNKYGKQYNVLAGFNRNKRMADYATHLIAIRKDKSSGTTNMIDLAKERKLEIFVKDI